MSCLHRRALTLKAYISLCNRPTRPSASRCFTDSFSEVAGTVYHERVSYIWHECIEGDITTPIMYSNTITAWDYLATPAHYIITQRRVACTIVYLYPECDVPSSRATSYATSCAECRVDAKRGRARSTPCGGLYVSKCQRRVGLSVSCQAGIEGISLIAAKSDGSTVP